MIRNVLVTGSEGYIGAVLVPLLLSHNYHVRGIDSCFYGRSNNTGYEFILEDIRSITKEDLTDIDAVIHLAALSNDPMGALNDELTQDINFKASVHLAALSKRANVKRFLFSSSCSIYGKTESGKVDETSPVDPLTEYARSKVATEKELQKLADRTFVVGILRNSTVYGYSPQFRDDLVVNNFVTTAFASHEIRVKSDGSPWRPLIDVRDLSSIFMSFLGAPAKRVNGQIFNIGFEGNNLRVRDILATVKKVLPDCSVIYTGEHGADTRSYRVNFVKFNHLFPAIRQHWPMEKSIIHMLKALKKEKPSHEGIYTRLTALQELIQSKAVDKHLFRTQKVIS